MAKITIPIGGMHCQNCVKAVTGKLSAMPGVSAVNVDLEKARAVVEGPELDVAGMVAAIEDLGFDPGEVS